LHALPFEHPLVVLCIAHRERGLQRETVQEIGFLERQRLRTNNHQVRQRIAALRRSDGRSSSQGFRCARSTASSRPGLAHTRWCGPRAASCRQQKGAIGFELFRSGFEHAEKHVIEFDRRVNPPRGL
jgi:hypothetical protein